MAFIVGYAGGDFLENIWKVIAGKAKQANKALKELDITTIMQYYSI